MAKEKIIVSGGAGYIGSHLVREAHKSGLWEVIVLDALITGHRAAVPEGVTLEVGNLLDSAFVEDVIQRHQPLAVMHFAASILVDESCRDPCKYYTDNVQTTNTLVAALLKFGVKYIIMSSTAALFGYPERVPIEEYDRYSPESAYGETKLVCEGLLKWADKLGLRYVCLRYFNACGADESGDIGEDHTPQTHLVPVVCDVALGKRDRLKIFGNDYETSDGTCVRDYVHVTDLAQAHILALQYLLKGNASNHFNLGSGNGYSVQEVLQACRAVTGHAIPADQAPRRDGDPSILVASSKKAEELLGWTRRYTDLKEIISTHWNFVQKHPNGYPKDH